MDWKPEDLGLDFAAAGLRDAAGARQTLGALLQAAPDPESFERLARRLLDRLAGCADPDRTLANFDRWFAQLGYNLSVQRMLTDVEFLMERLLQVFAASQYFSDILCRDPNYYEFLADPAALRRRTFAEIQAEVTRAVAPFRTYDGRLDALRRAKRREILRIGARDVTGLADFPEVVGELSAFADAAVREAYRISREETERRAGPLDGLEFAVIAMGKLGGEELNYSSDIDLMFVYRGGDQHVEAAHRIGERIIQALSRPTAEGYVFRVDMRLRPEGGLGALVRSLDAYRDYYDQYLEHWERQALLKARFVAGEESLGRDYHTLIAPYVYRPEVEPLLVEELRLNKLRLEKRVETAGETYTNVKDGYGGIRDIEFTVQMTQLLLGGPNPSLRTGNTLAALAALAGLGILSPYEHQGIREAYEFLRVVEHRLQILDERAVRCIPTDPVAVERLARRMPRSWRADPGAEFIAEYRRRAGTVRAFHRRLFYDPFQGDGAGDPLTSLGEHLLNLDTEAARGRIRDYLVARGFCAPDRALLALDRLALGSGRMGEWESGRVGGPGGGTNATPPLSHSPAPPLAHSPTLPLLARVGPRLLDAAAETPDPDAALAFAADMAAVTPAVRPTRGSVFSPRQGGAPGGATAPAMTAAVRREPALLDMLFEPEAVVMPADADALRQRLAIRLQRQKDHEGRLNALRRFKRRELLRIAAADVLAALDVEQICDQLTLLAEACIAGALDLCAAELRARGDMEDEPELAIFGLGKVGGHEMLYPSDLDLVLVCSLPDDDRRERRYLSYVRLSSLFQDALTRLLSDGDLYPLDLRLRPEGKGGEPVPSLDACRRYYAERAQTWERQAMVKARFLAGDARVAEEFLRIVTPFAYPEGMPAAMADEVRAMKRRIENERSSAATRGRDLKLGPGGLSDVEFLAQLTQMRQGHGRPALRRPDTLGALAALAAEGILPAAEAAALREGYRFQMRLRNLLYLRAGGHTSVLPEGDEDQRAVARALGMDNAGELLEAFYQHRRRVREIFEERFVRRDA